VLGTLVELLEVGVVLRDGTFMEGDTDHEFDVFAY